MLFLAHLIILAAASDLKPVGDYVVDVSQAERRNRGAIAAYFRGLLHIEAGGKFEFATINMQGFWRVEGDTLTLTYTTTLNGPPVMEPDEMIKHAPVTSPFDGHVMKVLPDGTLSLADFGACQGPIYFERAPEISIKKLVQESQLPIPGPGLEPFATLQNEAAQRSREVIAAVQDQSLPYPCRVTAAFSLRAGLSLGAERDVLDCLESLNDTNLKPEEVQSLRRMLAQSVADSGGHSLVIGLIADSAKFGIAKAILADGIAKAKLREAIPSLIEWAHSDNSADVVAAIKALVELNAMEGLPVMRAQATAQDPEIRLAANAALLRMSSDPTEQASAVAALLALKGLTGHIYINTDIIEGLGASRSKLAVSPLIDFLTKSPDEFDRRKAAAALGDLGFAEALPALKTAAQATQELKLDRTQSVEQQYAAVLAAKNQAKTDGWVRKNAIDAIWKIERLPRG